MIEDRRKKSSKDLNIMIDRNKWNEISKQLPGLNPTYFIDILLNNFLVVQSENGVDVNDLMGEAGRRTIFDLKVRDAN